jgi:hypothetical protein
MPTTLVIGEGYPNLTPQTLATLALNHLLPHSQGPYHSVGPKKEPSSGRILVTAAPSESRFKKGTVLPHQSGKVTPLRPRASDEMTMVSAVPMSSAPERT